MEKDTINGLKNSLMYLNGLKSRHPIRLCPICGQPVDSGGSKIVIKEEHIDRRKKSWNDGRIKSKVLFYAHIKCKNKMFLFDNKTNT